MPSRLISLTLASVTFGHGVAWGLINFAAILVLTNAGWDAADLAPIFSVAIIPWAAKPLFGLFIDRARTGKHGRQRPILIASGLLLVASLAITPAIDPISAKFAFVALVGIQNTFAAIQDVSTSAVLLAQVPQSRRGTVYGTITASKAAGVIVGGPIFSALLDNWSWSAITTLTAVAALLPLAFVLRLSEPDATPAPPNIASVFSQLKTAFTPTAARVGILAVATFALSDGILRPIVIPLCKNELSYSDDRIRFLGLLAMIFGVAAALTGGMLADRWGRRRTVLTSALLLMASNAIFGLTPTAWSTPTFVITYVAFNATAGGIVTASLLSLLMQYCHPAVAATQFQLYASLFALRLFWTPWVGGQLAQSVDSPIIFLIAAGVDVLPLVLLFALKSQPKVGLDQPPVPRDSHG